jgi:putative ubiquitin-RnfH superfamily antitoxin RatB of RatAB toxin-antitoxin module
MGNMINVEVYFVRAQTIYRYEVVLPFDSTIESALLASEFFIRHPDLQLGNLTLGIYGHKKNLQTVLRQGDRVEIYNPLLADPKDARHRRVGKELRSKF